MLKFFSERGELELTQTCLSRHKQLSVSSQTGNTETKQVAFFATLN